MIARAGLGLAAAAGVMSLASCMNDFERFEGSAIADAGADVRREAAPVTPPPPDAEADARPADAGADCRACVETKGTCRGTCEETRRSCDARCARSSGCLRRCNDDEDDCKSACESTCQRCGAGACDLACD